jgi:hypothetical protein
MYSMNAKPNTKTIVKNNSAPMMVTILARMSIQVTFFFVFVLAQRIVPPWRYFAAPHENESENYGLKRHFVPETSLRAISTWRGALGFNDFSVASVRVERPFPEPTAIQHR